MFRKQTNFTQRKFLVSVYIVILAVIAPALYSISNSDIQIPFTQKKDKNQIQNRISKGDKILILAQNNSFKQAGIEAFASGDYVTAQKNFDLSLKSNPNDPEALIYLNNTIAAKTQDPYTIGVSVPIGGNLNVAQEILRGVAQAQEEVNKNGGINGNLLMVEIANDDNDSNTALKVADKFVKNQKIQAVIGHNSSNVSLAVAPVYQESGLVMITPTSSAENLTETGDYIFRSTPNTRSLGQPLADYAVNTLGKSKIAICFDSGSKSIESFKDEFTWSTFNYGGEIVPVNCDFSAPDFLPSEIISQAISSGADGLLLAPSLNKIDDAIAIAKANQEKLTLFGTHTLNTYSTLKEGQNAIKGMVLAVAWNSLVQPNSDFVADAKKLWGGSVGWRTAMAYDAAKTIFQGMTAEDSRQGLQQALQNPGFTASGATSEVKFLPSGDRHLSGTLIEVQPGNRSGTGYDFVPLLDTAITSKPNP